MSGSLVAGVLSSPIDRFSLHTTETTLETVFLAR